MTLDPDIISYPHCQHLLGSNFRVGEADPSVGKCGEAGDNGKGYEEYFAGLWSRYLAISGCNTPENGAR